MMKLYHFSSKQITQIGRLIQKREALARKIEQIEKALSGFQPQAQVGMTALDNMARIAKLPGVRSKRTPGGLKEAILKKLSNAGARGITVNDLSAKLKVKPGNIFSWFYTTGKKISGIKKVGAARYALRSKNGK